MEKDLIKNAVIAESVLQDYVQRNCELKQSELVEQINKLLYETAQKHGISLYQLCSSVVPEISYDMQQTNPYEKGKDFKINLVTTITLKPIK